MAKLVIEINLDNAAFEENAEIEVESILVGLAKDIAASSGLLGGGIQFHEKLLDVNGNTVGFAKVKA